MPFGKNSKYGRVCILARACPEGEKHDARARGLERRRYARLALRETAQSDQDAHPGRGQGAPGTCCPERRARHSRSVNHRRAINRRPRTPRNLGARSAAQSQPPTRGLGLHARAVPPASATARDRLPSRLDLSRSSPPSFRVLVVFFWNQNVYFRDESSRRTRTDVPTAARRRPSTCSTPIAAAQSTTAS